MKPLGRTAMRISRILGANALAIAGVLSVSTSAQAASGPWVQVSAGGSHTCAISVSSSLYCWGRNSFGQIGDGTINTPRLSPYRVGAAGVWNSITAGETHTCGITTAKNLYCWGHNADGQVGDGTINTPRLSLYRVGAAGVWTTITAGGGHTCGITRAKNLYCWGFNTEGQIGDGSTDSPRLSLYRVGAAGVWNSIAAGGGHTCGITTAKNLYCWGYNATGQSGDGSVNSPRLSLYRVGAAGIWSNATVGGSHSCGVTTAEELFCWGANVNGQVGDGTTNTHVSPYRVD